jgi:phage baseplate assembly protein W
MSSLRFAPEEGPVVTAAGRLAMVHGDAAIRQAIILLLGTTPGERLMRPDYGSHLNRLLFAANDQTTAGLAIHYVRQALQRWEPRIEIEEIDADPDPEVASRLNIHLRYRVKQTLTVEVLQYPVSLGETS